MNRDDKILFERISFSHNDMRDLETLRSNEWALCSFRVNITKMNSWEKLRQSRFSKRNEPFMKKLKILFDKGEVPAHKFEFIDLEKVLIDVSAHAQEATYLHAWDRQTGRQAQAYHAKDFLLFSSPIYREERSNTLIFFRCFQEWNIQSIKFQW